MDVTLPSEISSSRREISLKTSSESLQFLKVVSVAGITICEKLPDFMTPPVKCGAVHFVFILYFIVCSLW